MKITYHPNPLRTAVELDEHERQVLLLKLEVEELKDRLAGVSVHLEEGEYFDLAAARRESDDLEAAAQEARRMFPYMLEALAGEHAGDCTCLPASCLKCAAESLAGINTIEGLSKHPASDVRAQFGQDDDIDALERAIARLLHYAPVRTGGWLRFPEADWARHLPRWREQAAVAAEWLTRYRELHFPAS